MTGLESMIADWRRRLAEGGLRDAGVVEELENHLREDIAAQISAGAEAQEAFATGVARLGPAEALTTEFRKVGGTLLRRLGPAWRTLAGIPPSHQPDIMNMNTASLNPEPRWATYTRAALFLIPAVLLTSFSGLFLMPKLQSICGQAGVRLPDAYQAAVFITDHPLLVALALILPLALLEWRSNRWPRFRRVSLGGLVFLLNASAMALLALMVIFALVAAPNLALHAR